MIKKPNDSCLRLLLGMTGLLTTSSNGRTLKIQTEALPHYHILLPWYVSCPFGQTPMGDDLIDRLTAITDVFELVKIGVVSARFGTLQPHDFAAYRSPPQHVRRAARHVLSWVRLEGTLKRAANASIQNNSGRPQGLAVCSVAG